MVKIKWAAFQQATRSRSLAAPVDVRAVLHEACVALIRSVYPVPKGIWLVGVTLSNFANGGAKFENEMSLLDESRLTA
jgi:DNA polymerase-4